MATRAFVRHALTLAAIAVATIVLATGALAATTPLHASNSEPQTVAALPDLVADAGQIAYVRRSTADIRLILPDGASDRLSGIHPSGLPAGDGTVASLRCVISANGQKGGITS